MCLFHLTEGVIVICCFIVYICKNITMKNRLAEFMRHESLSAAKLAEITGVQPSAISHMLSGRNKPGFDFIARLLDAFPALSPQWLILGKAPMITTVMHDNERQSAVKDDKGGFDDSDNDPAGYGAITQELFPTAAAFPDLPDEIPASTCADTPVKGIERIVIFYNDGTFESFNELYKNK